MYTWRPQLRLVLTTKAGDGHCVDTVTGKRAHQPVASPALNRVDSLDKVVAGQAGSQLPHGRKGEQGVEWQDLLQHSAIIALTGSDRSALFRSTVRCELHG